MTDPNESAAGAGRWDEDSGGGTDDEAAAELPADVVDDAERLTRLARRTADETEARAYETQRDRLLETHDFTARIRDEDADEVLVLHPEEWHDDENDVIRTDRIDDVSRAVEIPLEGTGDPDDWEEIEAHNRALVERVRERHGDVHGDNAAALADFVGNHYAKRIEELTGAELAEFRTDYFVRNAWPSPAQRDRIDDTIELVYEHAGEPVPDGGNRYSDEN